jgi:ElaB/YqjD/DUF883 family membrane-anchored ribosome-binding protein
MTGKLEAIETKIKGTVDDTTSSIKRTFDFKYQVGQHPWVAFGAAIAVGFMLGGRDDRYAHYEMPRYAQNGNGFASAASSAASSDGPGLLDQLGDSVGGELQMLKSMAASALVALITDTIKRNIPVFKDAIDRARNSATTTPKQSYSPADTYTRTNYSDASYSRPS